MIKCICIRFVLKTAIYSNKYRFVDSWQWIDWSRGLAHKRQWTFYFVAPDKVDNKISITTDYGTLVGSEVLTVVIGTWGFCLLGK